MRQFFKVRDNATTYYSLTSQGPEKNRKKVRPQCLDGVATINIVKWQWPDNIVKLTRLRQNCRVPSSVYK